MLVEHLQEFGNQLKEKHQSKAHQMNNFFMNCLIIFGEKWMKFVERKKCKVTDNYVVYLFTNSSEQPHICSTASFLSVKSASTRSTSYGNKTSLDMILPSTGNHPDM